MIRWRGFVQCSRRPCVRSVAAALAQRPDLFYAGPVFAIGVTEEGWVEVLGEHYCPQHAAEGIARIKSDDVLKSVSKLTVVSLDD